MNHFERERKVLYIYIYIDINIVQNDSVTEQIDLEQICIMKVGDIIGIIFKRYFANKCKLMFSKYTNCLLLYISILKCVYIIYYKNYYFIYICVLCIYLNTSIVR